MLHRVIQSCCVMETERNTEQILARDLGSVLCLDILRNAFVLALGRTVLAETLVLVPAFFLELGEPGLIPS